MITFSKFGNYGRTGNQLFQYAAMLGLCYDNGVELRMPAWDDAKYFKGVAKLKALNEPIPADTILNLVQEPCFHYTPKFFNGIDYNKDIDFLGYFQSPKYWRGCESFIKEIFQFTDELKAQVVSKSDTLAEAFEKETIAISIRRGDYVDNPNYECLPITYYLLALFENFPNWRDCNLIIFSDDIPYCKVNFDCLDNVYFPEHNSAIEDLCLMSQCTHHIISNSTFGWWGAYIGEKEGTKVVHPAYHFRGKLMGNDMKDYYPENWITFDHKNAAGENIKIDLTDVTFTIPVAFDHEDRINNLNLSVRLLQKSFDTNIDVMEKADSVDAQRFKYIEERGVNYTGYIATVFHRTQMLNLMAKRANTAIIVNWDADIIIPVLQLLEAVNKVRAGADMVFPYDGRFARIPRDIWFSKLQCFEEIGIIGDTKFNGMNNNDAVSVGGAVLFNRASFIAGGMENEKFISFGAEDVERDIRFPRLGFKKDRVGGCLYHVNHYVGTDSSSRNPYFFANDAEMARIHKMSKEELEAEVASWQWTKN